MVHCLSHCTFVRQPFKLTNIHDCFQITVTSDWDKHRYFNFVLLRQAGSFPHADTQKKLELEFGAFRVLDF